MDILNTVLNFIGIIVIAIGVVFIYDARKLTKKFFSTTDVNIVTRNLKIVGFIISLIGCGIFLV